MTTTTTTLPATVREIMTHEIVTLDPDMTLREAIGVLDAEGISGAPVVSHGTLLGVLSATDLLAFEATTSGVPTADTSRAQEPAVGAEEPQRDETSPVSAWFTDMWDNAGADVLERMRTAESPEWDVLSEHVVSEVMSPNVHAVQADATLAEAAAYMVDHRIHRVLVVDGARLLGIVSASDFLRAIASS
ncbi:MAG TPA: CBS domain-containing protein [Gemmatimonadales bacterium]|nr:CBS domain-containing protein [Gemmatimonadales bacterium]